MKRKKEPVAETVIQHEPVVTHIPADAEGVIDLDPVHAQSEPIAGPEPVRRKTRRTRKTVTVTPTLINRDEIHDARIQVFTEYVNGKCELTHATEVDAKLRELDTLAVDLNKHFEVKK